MSGIGFYIQVVKALEEIEAPYMIVGAFAGLAYGLTRSTYDVDILVDLREKDFEPLAARFPLPRYYADPVMMRNSTRMGIMFNLIDTGEGVKADLVPMKREPEYRVAFDRRIRRTFKDETGATFSVWCAQPTDITIGKLRAWTEGRSSKHPADICNMLRFSLSGLGSVPIDLAGVESEAARMGPETLKLWRELVTRVEGEVSQSTAA